AGELVRHGILPPDLVVAGASAAAAYEARIRPGVLDEPEVGSADLDPHAARNGALPTREQIARIQADIERFRVENELDAVVTVNLASTEASGEERAEWKDLPAFEAALDAGRPQPASLLYAYAAFAAGSAFVNFTPNRGASIPALRALAAARRLPHCGNDGKTGET